MANKLTALVIVAMLSLAGLAGYRLVQSQIAAQVYRQRLTKLNADYDQLRQRYNQVVVKTAATLLLVHHGKLTVVVRDADGTVKKIPTPYDPSHEIYVDYIVKDGRLWIRRVFDDRTAPNKGTLINPRLGAIKWGPSAPHGKAVYRALSPGVWEVTVTGNGSLGLHRCATCDASALVAQPPVRSYKPLKKDHPLPSLHIGPGQVFAHLLGEGG